MPNKAQAITEYIINLARQLNQQYKGIIDNSKIQRAITMFKDSPEDYNVIVQKINALAKQTIENYLAEIEKMKAMEQMRMEIDANKNGVYLDSLSVNLLTIVNCSSHDELIEYFKKCGQPQMIQNLNIDQLKTQDLDTLKRMFFKKYQDSLVDPITDSTLTQVEKADRKLTDLAVPENAKEYVLSFVREGKIQEAYKALEATCGKEVCDKFNHFQFEDFSNVKSATYEQFTELNSRIKNNGKIDTIVTAMGKYGSCMNMTKDGMRFDPSQLKLALDYAEKTGKHIRINGVFDYEIAQKFADSGFDKSNHDEVFANMQNYVTNLMNFISSYNNEKGKNVVETVEIFNELVEYNKPQNARDHYEETWDKFFGISLEELVSVFDNIKKPNGVRYMYNETMLEESPAHLQKVETTFNKIKQLRPELIDVFGNQLHVFASGELTDEQKKAHIDTSEMMGRIKNNGTNVEITEFDITIPAQRVADLKARGISDDTIYGVKANVANDIRNIYNSSGINLERTTYWGLLSNVSHGLTQANVERVKNGEAPVKTLYDGLYEDLDFSKNKDSQNLESDRLMQIQTEKQQLIQMRNNLSNYREANPNQTYETQQNNLQSPVNQAPTQTNGKQKTLGVHPAMKQNNSNTNGAISTFIITLGILFSSAAAIYLNLLV